MRGARATESLESAFQQLKEMLSGAALRAVAGLKDAGAIATAIVGDDTAQPHTVHSQKHDVWTLFTDVLTGISGVGRLYAPAGVLWRFTPKGMGAIVVRARKMLGAGAALVIPDGGDGSSQVVPGFDDGTNLDKDNAGIFLPEGWHIESTGDRVRLVANSGGTKCIVELQKGGSIVITPSSGQTVQVGGNAQSGVRGEDLETWLMSHTHGTPVGPSSTPVQPFTPTILSSVVKLV